MSASADPIRHNRYAARCANCGENVPAEAGALTREEGRWVTRHIGGCGGEAATPQASTSGFTPTAEQQAALDLFAQGESMVIEAGAGTGKTATLVLLAGTTNRRGQYVAFNKSIVDEASSKFGQNVACNTAHSLAFRAVGREYSHRLNAPRQSIETIARTLGLDPFTIVDDGEVRTLAPAFLASKVMASVTRFCQSADAEPQRRHIPYIDGIDTPTLEGHRTFANNDELASYLLPFVKRAWADLSKLDGQLRFGHDHYLKIWHLSGPRIDADFILFDEAQDANPVMAAIVAAQSHAQVVYVGDSQQAIYEFTGAVNALANIDSQHRVFLTQSFRFGPAVADVANQVLDRLGAELRLSGTPTIPSLVGVIEREDAILCRTNAHAVETMLALQTNGRRPHLMGGGKEAIAFAKAARDLQASGRTSHPELACFTSWESVQSYVATDEGGDLKLMVTLVDKFGIETILTALDRMPTERQADVVVSTAHKSKGREWDQVRLGSDFPTKDGDMGDSEKRLLYVAVTRGKLALDITTVSAFFESAKNEKEES